MEPLKLIYNFFVVPFWFLCLFSYVIDALLRFTRRVKEPELVSRNQILCFFIFTAVFFVLLSITYFVDAVVILTTAIFLFGTHILPIFGVYNFRLFNVIKRVFRYFLSSERK